MKKGTKTWLLYYYIVIHLLATAGTTGLSVLCSLEYPGIWNWFLLMGIAFLNYFIFDSMFSYVRKIQRRNSRKF